MKKILYLLSLICFSCFSCQNDTKPTRTAPPPKAKDAIELPPKLSEADKKYVDIFKKYEGTWKGNYITIKDIDPLLKTSIDLENLKLEYVTKPGLTMINNMEAEHTFSSKSAYFQEFTYYDYYPFNKKTITIDGNNRVENGQLLRYLKTPKESITLNGMVKNDSTIVWKFEQEKPQRVEYYQEIISDQFLEIIGYKYDELDRLDLGPKKWFYGKFAKSAPTK